MENGYFELQALEGAVGVDVRESFGELFGRSVGWEGFYWVGSRRAECFSYRIQVVRIPSQNSDGEISMGWMGKYSTYTCTAGRSLRRDVVNTSIKMARRL